jgi:hypothetical protein
MAQTMEILFEVLAIHEVHDEITAVVPLETLAHAGDVIVVERLEPAALQLELLASAGSRVRKLLEGVDIIAAIQDVGDAIHHSEAASAHHAQDLIATANY